MSWPVSERFTRAVRGSHTVATRVEVLLDGLVERPLDGLVISGSVDEERTAVRRRCSVEIADVDGVLTPREATDLFAPTGAELRLWRGVRYFGGGEELVPLGVFRVSELEIDWPRIGIAGLDRGDHVARQQFLGGYQIDAGVDVADAITGLLTPRLPGVEVVLSRTGYETPRLLWDTQADPWAVARGLAVSIGHELYFDRLGQPVLVEEPDLAAQPPVASYAEGPGSVLVAASRSLSNRDVFNGVLASGEHPDQGAPVAALVVDTDPASATFWFGRYGQIPEFYTSAAVRTETQAAAAGAGRLRRVRGLVEAVDVELVPDPAREAGDVIHVARARGGIDTVHAIDKLRLPLGTGTASASTRSRPDEQAV